MLIWIINCIDEVNFIFYNWFCLSLSLFKNENSIFGSIICVLCGQLINLDSCLETGWFRGNSSVGFKGLKRVGEFWYWSSPWLKEVIEDKSGKKPKITKKEQAKKAPEKRGNST